MDEQNESIFELKLPEIEGRTPYDIPTSYLVKDGENNWKTVSGRRPSNTMLVNGIRKEVDSWRLNDYAGASDTSKRLLEYWFDEDHLLSDGKWYKFYYCQREAIETLIYLYEVKGYKDCFELIREYFEEPGQTIIGEAPLELITTTQGQRRVKRYVEEAARFVEQDLPNEGLPRYSIKMGTGTGKTTVMALCIVWSYFHRKFEDGSGLANNFLVIAPNVIVYERLKTDFGECKIFNELPLIPPEWRNDWQMDAILREDSNKPKAQGNLFLTNIQQIYDRDEDPIPSNPIQAMLGKAPSPNLSTTESMLDRVKRVKNLMVINDEAHHVHDDELAWNQTLLSLDENLKFRDGTGLIMWLDFSATPKNQNGTFFPWIIVDYPLAQAVEDKIVKTPLIIHQTEKKDPGKHRSEDAGDVYSEWITIAVERWREHREDYGNVGVRPILFVMAEDTKAANSVAERLKREPEFSKDENLLLIHTDKKGEVSKADLEIAREAARNVDSKKSKINAVVSVMMLREGWDVRNVTVILGLRPFTSKANILPEQAIGRGLRRIRELSERDNQILELIGTPAFEDFIKELEKEGVGVAVTKTPPPSGVKIYPMESKRRYDIAIPRTSPRYKINTKELDKLNPKDLKAITSEANIDDIKLKRKIALIHGTVNVQVATSEIEFNEDNIPSAETFIAALTDRIIKNARLVGCFAELYPKVRYYVKNICFGKPVDLEKLEVRQAISESILLEAISNLFSRKIGELTTKNQEITLEVYDYKMSEVEPFTWRRCVINANKTIFNAVACYNLKLEGAFAAFLDSCNDVDRFVKLAEWFTGFSIDYLSSSGGRRYYYPDFVVVQKVDDEEVYWIVETKGREDDDVALKDAHMKYWCEQVSKKSRKSWEYLKVPQAMFVGKVYNSFQQLVEAIRMIENSIQMNLFES